MSTKALIDKLIKGGVGSGKKGHTTVKQDPHLHFTTAGKKIPTKFTPEMQSDDWTEDDHREAMNFHYEVAKRIKERLTEHMQSNPSFKHHKAVQNTVDHHFKEAKIHQKHMSTKMDDSQKLKTAIKDKRDFAVKKSEMEMDKQGTTIQTSDYSKDLDSAKTSRYLQIIEDVMEDYKYGENPKVIPLDNGVLFLSRVDEGIYSGFVRKTEDEMSETIARIEKMTIPTVIQYLRAKEVIDTKDKNTLSDQEILIEKLEPAIEDELMTVSQSDKVRMLEILERILNGA